MQLTASLRLGESLPADMTPDRLRHIASVVDAYEAALGVIAADNGRPGLFASPDNAADLRRWADEIEEVHA